MKLTQQQLEHFDEEGWIFLENCFSPEEVAVLNEEARKFTPRNVKKSGAKHQAHPAQPLQPTPITKRLASLAAIPA